MKRFAGRGYEVEDLFQTGTIGLMKAIDHFDLSYDVKFFYICGSSDCRRDPAFSAR